MWSECNSEDRVGALGRRDPSRSSRGSSGSTSRAGRVLRRRRLGRGRVRFAQRHRSGRQRRRRKEGGNDRITGEEMNSILAFVGRFMNET